MTIHNTTQICGTAYETRIWQSETYTFVEMRSGNTCITMEPKHVRQLQAALEAFEAQAAQVSARDAEVDWFPIDDAPRDGTEFLACLNYGGTDEYAVMRWTDCFGEIVGMPVAWQPIKRRVVPAAKPLTAQVSA